MKIKHWLQNNIKQQKGFTLLFAVLVSTLVVAIGATVISIALRQTILSGTSRESQYAFYAANTVLECAFYWDVVGMVDGDGPVFPVGSESPLSDMSQVRCADGVIATGSGFGDNGSANGADFADAGWTRSENITTFRIEITDVTGDFPHLYCAEATVTKTVEPDDDVITTIEAKGYNTCDLASPRAVERGLLQSYQS